MLESVNVTWGVRTGIEGEGYRDTGLENVSPLLPGVTWVLSGVLADPVGVRESKKSWSEDEFTDVPPDCCFCKDSRSKVI